MKRTQTKTFHRLFCLLTVFALSCAAFAVLSLSGGTAKRAYALYPPNDFSAVTAKPNTDPGNAANLLRAGGFNSANGSSRDRLATFAGEGVQETTSWYSETVGWARS
ncbi:MAG: hypothetical protein LBH24_04105, partial [Clostridiales bacterium]|nr:hypothetical protein [Clostridiales bacterium]